MTSPFMTDRRRVIRANSNPLDKSTVVSIFPKDIIEVKCTIQPGRFNIKPGTYDNPSILVVGSSSWWKELDLNQPHLEIPQGSLDIARSIVEDYCVGLLAYSKETSMPGLFWVPGEHTVKEVKEEFKELLDRALVKQKNWYKALIAMADSLWSQSNGNPRAISDDMKRGAEDLGLEKSWNRDFTQMQLDQCPACGALWDKQFPLCKTCGTIIDKDRYESLGLSKPVKEEKDISQMLKEAKE